MHMAFENSLFRILFYSLHCRLGICNSLYFCGLPKTSWDAAEMNCDAIGMSLATIKSLRIQNEIDELFNTNVIDSSSELWIGLSWRTINRTFFWIDNTEIAFTNWDVSSGDPNNMEGTLNFLIERCVRIVKGKWRTTKCKDLKNVLCMANDLTYIPVPPCIESITHVTSSVSSVNKNTELPSFSLDERMTTLTEPSTSEPKETTLLIKNVASTAYQSEPTLNSATTTTDDADRFTPSLEMSSDSLTITHDEDKTTKAYSPKPPRDDIVTTAIDISAGSTETKQHMPFVAITAGQSELTLYSTSTDYPDDLTSSLEMATDSTTITHGINTSATRPAGSRAIVFCPYGALSLCDCEVVQNMSQGEQGTSIDYIYRIDKRSTSAFIRKYNSAYDGRFSDKVMGFSGSAVLVFVVLSIVCLDVKRTPKVKKNKTK